MTSSNTTQPSKIFINISHSDRLVEQAQIKQKLDNLFKTDEIYKFNKTFQTITNKK